MGSRDCNDRRGEEGENVGEPRGEEPRREEEPSRSPLSGTSSARLLRLRAGLVALTLGGAAGSRVLPKFPAAGGTSQVRHCSGGGEEGDELTERELKADWLVPDLPVDHCGLEQRREQQETLRSVVVPLQGKTFSVTSRYSDEQYQSLKQ